MAKNEPPAIRRLHAVLAELSSVLTNHGSAKQKSISLVVRRVVNDMCEELSELPPDHMELYFTQMADVVRWIGTGRLDDMSEAMQQWIGDRAEGVKLAIEGEKPEELSLFEVEEVVATTSGGDNELSGANTRSG
ncbi:MAG: hypothetical protein WAL41_10740 [Mycobacterium sp.]